LAVDKIEKSYDGTMLKIKKKQYESKNKS